MKIHAMNKARREAFDMMRRQSLRAQSRATSTPLWATYFRDEIMGSSIADALEDLGWLTILPGRRGRPSQIHLGVSASRILRHGETQPARDFEVYLPLVAGRGHGTMHLGAVIDAPGFVARRGYGCRRWELYLVDDDGVEMFIRYAEGWENDHLSRAVEDARRRGS